MQRAVRNDRERLDQAGKTIALESSAESRTAQPSVLANAVGREQIQC
jgi:hypothetical protein